MIDDFIRPQGRLIWKDQPLGKVEPIITDPPFHTGGTNTGRWSRQTVVPTFKIAVKGSEQFQASIQKVREQVQEYQDRVVLMALYAGFEATPMYAREHRIATLLLSKDRRQHKRGNRLFRKWRKTRPGFNFQPYRKD